MNVLAEDYYDNVYQRMIDNPQRHGWDWLRNRVNSIAPHVIGNSVLDLGCGLALIADRIGDIFYVGVDFSSVAIGWCKQNVENSCAIFIQDSVMEWIKQNREEYDTVIMMEVLEHLAHPEILMKEALQLTCQRMIITVPRNMPGKGHVHPKWTKVGLHNILGACEISIIHNQWWMVIKDV